MKEQKFKDHIYWGLTALAVVAVSVAFIFFLSRFKVVKATLALIINVLMPVIYGAVLAYLILPVYNKSRLAGEAVFKKLINREKYYLGGAKVCATVISLVVIFVIVAGLFRMLIPQIYESIINLQASLEGNVNNLTIWLQQTMAENSTFESWVIPAYEQLVYQLQNWLKTDLVPNMSTVISGLSSGLISVVVILKNILIGLIVMVYFLNIKDTFAAQGKKILYSTCSLKRANWIIEELRFTHRVFGGFITGKLLDSLIIGILCFFCLNFMDMPYAMLVSVIVGVTNVIPFFGPFIGAVPSAFLILLVNPKQCLYFLIFVLILQQFDGNILGPKILGDSTGLPSFWVLFSILLFGGLFGFVGMIIAVPTFAVAYRIISDLVNRSLTKKQLPSLTQDYMELDHIDEEKKTFIK